MKNHLYRSSLTVLFVLVAAVSGYSQKAKAPLIDERNVRAEMNFLAGDAMQGLSLIHISEPTRPY